MPEHLLRLKQNLHGGRDVCGGIRLNHGKEPPLVLHRSRNAEIGAHPVITSDARVGQRTSTGNELLTYLLVPEIELNSVARAEPIIGPRLSALPAAAHPVP